MRKTRKGFNLIVLVIVIALIALLFCVTNKQFNIISGIAKSNQILQYYDENTVFVLYTKYLDENQTVLSPTTVKTQNMDQLNYKIDIPTIDGYTPKITELEGKLDLEGLEYLEKLDFVRIVVKDNIYNIYITINYAAAPSAYSVVYYEQKSDLSGYTEISREVIGKLGNSYDGSIVTGQKINIIPSEKEGFSINIGKTKTAGKVEAFGTKVFEIYYDRNNYYLYTYNTGDSYYEPMQVKYGQDLRLIEEPTYSGYVFDGWAYSTSMNGDKIEKPDTMPAYNLYAEAQWKRDATHYILSYYTENANDNGYTNIGTTEVSATSGDNLQNVDLTNEIENGFEEVRGDTAEYYHYNEEKTKEANNNFDVIVEGNGVTVVAIYYDRNVYTIEMDFNDSSYTTKGEVTKDGQVYTGSYSFQAKYDQDIMEEWLTAGDFTTFPTSTSRGRTTTYYFRGWKTDSSSSTYTSMRINLTSDLIADSTNGSTTVYEAQYVTSNSQKELFYMIESFDQETKTTSDTRKLYNGKYYDSNEIYYQLVYSTSTSWSAKQLAGLTSVGTQSSNPKFYFYYDRNVETITLFNMNNVHIEKQLKYGESLEEFSNTQLNASDFSLETPGTKEWKFEGWYQDSNYMLPMEWTNEDGTYKTIRENLVLYAKWSAPTYTVTFETNGGTWTEIDSRYVKVDDDTYTLTVEEGESLKKPTDPTKSGNVPLGWYYKVDSNEIEYLFSDSQKVYSDVKLNLKYLTNANVSYRVRYVQAQYEDGQLVEDISKYDNIVDLAEPKEVEGNLYGSTVYETPVDIYDAQNADNYFVVNMRDEELFLGSENINDNELYFLYAKNPTLSYSVYYVKYKEDENGNQITYDYGDVPSDDMLLGKKEGIVSAGYITERAEEIDGWTINGKESQTLKLVLNESDNTLYFYYDENTTGEYLVNFFFMNENGEYENTPDYTYTAVDSGGTILYASDFENFVFETGPTEETYRGRRLDKEKCENAYLIVTTTTETSAMDLYFENLTDLSYAVKYQDEDGNFLQDEKVVENQMYSSSVTEKAVDIKGYELIDGEQEEKTITIDIDNNEIIFTYKKLENLSYTVKYLEYGTNLEIADVKTVENNLYQSVVIEEAIDIEGYDKVDSTSQELTIDVTDNEIIFYYKKRADISYTVEYYFDNVIDKSKTELIKNQTYGDVITDYIDKIKTGYKFNSSTAPITLGVDNNVIKVYYVTDEEQTKAITYMVEYYKGGKLVESDTQIVTKTVQALEPDILTVKKDEINTSNKYDGYKFIISEPEIIPDEISDGAIIQIYYEKDLFGYSIEYYYDGIKDDEKTGFGRELYENKIESYEDKNIIGYKLDKVEGNPITITSNAVNNVMKVYYTKRTDISYKVEYYYNGAIDNEQTEIVENQMFGTTITNYTDKVKKGYKLESNTLPVTLGIDNNVIKVYYVADEKQTKELKYTVEYYKNGKKVEEDTQNVSSVVQYLEPNTLIVQKGNINTTNKYYGYKYESGSQTEIPDVVNDGDVIRVYYVTDEEETKELTYTVEYYKDGVIEDVDTQIVTKTVQVLEPNTIEVNKSEINTSNKYNGYKFVESSPETIPNEISTGEIIKVYYEKDEEQTKELTYTVEYYKNGVIEEADTQVVTKTVQVLEPDIIEVNKEQINTINKYSGYKFEKTEPEAIPNVVNNGDIIKVYYVIDEKQTKELRYTVEYYKDGIIVDADTQIVTKTVHLLEPDTLEVNKNEINTNNKYAGYRVASVYPEVIPDLVNNGDVIKVYYEKDEFEYRVEYYYDGLRYDENTENYVGTYNDVITTYTDKNVFGYKLEKTENLPLTITKDSEDNVIKIYYIIDEENTKTLSYTVEYYKNNELISEDVQTVSKTVQVLEPNSLVVDKSQINKTNKYEGYVFKGTEPEIIPNVVLTGEVIKVFYEIRADLQYTVKYLENGTTNEIISTKVVSDKAYNDEITEFAVDIPGYNKLKESETIKIGLGTNEIIFFYERKADLEYRVEYYYNGQRDNDKTEIHNATFLEEIEKYTNNALVGYKLEKEENFPLIINSDESKNIIRIYYVTDEEQTKEIKYTVEYYKENVLVEVDTQEEKKIVQALEPDILNVDKTQINTVDKYTGYKFDASATGTIPDVAKDGTVIKIYYVIDESNTKTLSYTVEYYKNGVIESSDTQVVSETVHILRPDTIDVRKGEINTSNKYAGYKLSVLTPNPIPDKVANRTVIKVNYVTDENQRKDLSYTIEYYKDGEKQVAETKEVSINVQLLEPDTINVDKSEIILSGKYTGYKLSNTSPETIPSVVNNGDVIKIYYVKDQFGYKVEYYYDGQIDDTKTENYIATYKDIIKEYTDKNIFGYRLEKVEGAPLEVSEKIEENVIKVYYIIDDGNTKTLNYTVEYYKDGELQEGDTQIVSKTVQILESDVLEVNKSEINIIDKYVGYKLEKTMPDAIPDSVLTGETIKVYYVKDNFNYTIEYYYDGQLDASKTEISSEKYEQIIESYQDKTGGKYNLINAENFPLKISESSSNNIIKINYEKKKSKITVHYYLNNSKGGLVSQDIVIEDVVDTVHTINAASDVALKYELIKKPDLEQLTMTVDPIEVEYIYRLKDAKVIVNYVEKGVEKILGTDIIKGQVDDEYQAAPKAIEGYKYLTDKMPKNEAGKMTLDPITVNFYYEFITSSSPEVQTLPTTSTTQTTVGSVNGAKDNYNSKGPYTGDNDVYTNLAIILIVLSLNTIQITISYDGRKAVRKIKRTYECKRREKKEKRNNKISRISKEVINNRKPKHSSTRRERKH